MAVANRAEVIYILETLVQEIKNITPASQDWFTEVKNVFLPSFHWSDDVGILAQTPRPCVMIWCAGIGQASKGHTFGERRMFMRTVIVGVTDTPHKNQAQNAMLSLWDDVHRTITKNQARTFPSTPATNEYGVVTADAPGTSSNFEVRQTAQNRNVGIFVSGYDIEYRSKLQ